jgi:hypothetical protein
MLMIEFRAQRLTARTLLREPFRSSGNPLLAVAILVARALALASSSSRRSLQTSCRRGISPFQRTPFQSRRAIARHWLLSEDKLEIARRVGVGKKVLLADMRPENAKAAAEVMDNVGYDVSVATVDVSSREAVHALVEQATSLFDVTGLIHAAGVSPSQASPANVQLPLRFGSFADLSGALAMADVDGLPRVTGVEFDPWMPMLWIEGRNMMDGGAVWLPFEIVHANSTISGEWTGTFEPVATI